MKNVVTQFLVANKALAPDGQTHALTCAHTGLSACTHNDTHIHMTTTNTPAMGTLTHVRHRTYSRALSHPATLTFIAYGFHKRQ